MVNTQLHFQMQSNTGCTFICNPVFQPQPCSTTDLIPTADHRRHVLERVVLDQRDNRRRRSRCGLGNSRTTFRVGSAGLGITSRARFFGRLPPNTRAILNKEWLPQTMQVSCGLSLTTSHSTHKTAFSSGTVFRTRGRNLVPSSPEPFITEPRHGTSRKRTSILLRFGCAFRCNASRPTVILRDLCSSPPAPSTRLPCLPPRRFRSPLRCRYLCRLSLLAFQFGP